MYEVIVLCPAKINMFLNIIGQKNNMHLLKMINQSVNLYDYLTIKPNGTGNININCNNLSVPTDERNSCFKAALIMQKLFHINFGFDINITKNIPLEAGLGGESTDAAGVILGIKEMLGLQIGNDDLATIGFQIGADVPFCLIGGTCLVQGFGEHVTKIQMKDLNYLIVKPNFNISTTDAFHTYDKLCAKYKEFDGFIVGQNDFEIIMPPEIQEIKSYLTDQGAFFTNMSGSGSSIIGAFNSKEKRIRALKNLKKYFQDYNGYLANPCDGIEVLKKTRLN